MIKQQIKAFLVLITGLALYQSAIIHSAKFLIAHWRKSPLARWTKFSFEEVCGRSEGPVDRIGGIPSAITCGFRCSANGHCKSLYYYGRIKSCQISNQTTFFSEDESCAAESKVLYGKVVKAGVDLSDWIGNPCRSDADCTRINSACIESSCTCKNGYSYRSSDGTCMDFCDEYGSTFKEEGYYIAETNIEGWTNITLDDCFQQCIDSDVLCRFVEFDVQNNGHSFCYITNETGLTKPDQYIKQSGSKTNFQQYLRSCT